MTHQHLSLQPTADASRSTDTSSSTSSNRACATVVLVCVTNEYVGILHPPAATAGGDAAPTAIENAAGS